MEALAAASGSLWSSPGAKRGGSGLPSLRCYSLRRLGSGVSKPLKARLPSFVAVRTPRAAYPTAVEDGSSNETDAIPTPKVIIDQDSSPDATIVEITFGDRLGALLDTMNSLKNLGLHVVKAHVYMDSSGKHNKFAITNRSTGRKIEDPELLETIRLTIINNMLQYHPESSSQLAMGATFGVEPPEQKVDVDIATHINIFDDGPDRSLLVVETADRPGLLVDLVKIITDINITVQSGEFDTEGLLAKAKFHVSYRNEPITKALQQNLLAPDVQSLQPASRFGDQHIVIDINDMEVS